MIGADDKKEIEFDEQLRMELAALLPKSKNLPTDLIEFVKEWIEKLLLIKDCNDIVFIDFNNGEVIKVVEDIEYLTLLDLKNIAISYRYYSTFHKAVLSNGKIYTAVYCVERK